MKTLAFANNIFGPIKEDIRIRLQAVIDNPCQDTWDDAYTIILTTKGRMPTLWNAVRHIDPEFPMSKPLDDSWPSIPTSDTIKKAINWAVFEYGNDRNLN
jgi:glutathionylspermidine synthase